MRSTLRFVWAVILFLPASYAAMDTDFASLGRCDETVIRGGAGDECSGATVSNHDGSFENGYCWRYGGIAPPYYGAFAEGYDAGFAAVNVECGLFWLSQLGYYQGAVRGHLCVGGRRRRSTRRGSLPGCRRRES